MPVAKIDLEEVRREIRRLKAERNALILAHNYQAPEVQEIADVVGDSLGLSRTAAKADADVIVFCGVHFMAETAAILSPEKTVLLPDRGAGCSLASMMSAESLRRWKADHPGAVVVTYVNSSAEVKAESDYCCTSSNATEVVRAIPEDREILFGPDQFLGAWVKRSTGRENMHIWGGYCHAHNRITHEDVVKKKKEHPGADFLMHPECGCMTASMPLADKVLSTSGIVRHARESPKKEFIIGTEVGILSRLRRENPGKQFHPVSEESYCEFMKLIDLEKVLFSLEEMEYRITVPPDIAKKARRAIDRMVEIG